MDATREAEGLLDKIRPPRLEDAGLEDCALPPESIKEAFLKAATAVGSRGASIFPSSEEEERDASEEEGRCMNDPWPNVRESSDTLIGIRKGIDPPPGACGGGVPEVMGDEVPAGVTDAEEKAADKVVTGPDVTEGGEDSEEACVDGLQGLKIGDHKGEDKGEASKNDEEDEEEQESEKPILAEAYV